MNLATNLLTSGTTIKTEGKATTNAFIKATDQIFKKSSTKPILMYETTPDMINVIKLDIKKANSKNSYLFGIILNFTTIITTKTTLHAITTTKK